MEQSDLLAYALSALTRHGIAHMLVGSMASSVYGEGRSTLDIDIVVDLSAEHVPVLAAEFPAPEYYRSVATMQSEIDRGGQFNVIHVPSGNKIDFMVARRDAWGREQLSRRREEFVLPNQPGFVAAPEDVILAKMIYYKVGEHEKHLRDIASMLRISKDVIDVDYIERWVPQLEVDEVWHAIKLRLQDAKS